MSEYTDMYAVPLNDGFGSFDIVLETKTKIEKEDDNTNILNISETSEDIFIAEYESHIMDLFYDLNKMCSDAYVSILDNKKFGIYCDFYHLFLNNAVLKEPEDVYIDDESDNETDYEYMLES